MNKKRYFSARNVTMLAVLMALVIVLQTFGGAITIGAVQLNFTLIPIVLGAILLGSTAGLILGFACGIVVMIQVILGLVPFYTVIWTGAPVVSILTCILKTSVAGWLAGFLYNILKTKNRYVALFVAAATVPVVNTALFILGCLGMWNAIASMAGGSNIFGFILVGLVSFNFFIELAVNLVCAPAISRVVDVVEGVVTKKKISAPPVDKSDADKEGE